MAATVASDHPPQALEVAGPVAFISLWIPGEPVQKDRPRFRVLADGRAMAYTTAATRKWESHVGEHAAAQLHLLATGDGPEVVFPLDGRIIAKLKFFVSRPDSVKDRPVPWVKPDLENLTKAVLDGLEGGGIIKNDSRVTDLTSSKRYADDFEPGVHIEMTAWL